MEEGGKRSQDLRASLCWARCRPDARPCFPGLPALASAVQLLSDALGAQPFVRLLLNRCSGGKMVRTEAGVTLRGLCSPCACWWGTSRGRGSCPAPGSSSVGRQRCWTRLSWALPGLGLGRCASRLALLGFCRPGAERGEQAGVFRNPRASWHSPPLFTLATFLFPWSRRIPEGKKGAVGSCADAGGAGAEGPGAGGGRAALDTPGSARRALSKC